MSGGDILQILREFGFEQYSQAFSAASRLRHLAIHR